MATLNIGKSMDGCMTIGVVVSWVRGRMIHMMHGLGFIGSLLAESPARMHGPCILIGLDRCAINAMPLKYHFFSNNGGNGIPIRYA